MFIHTSSSEYVAVDTVASFITSLDADKKNALTLTTKRGDKIEVLRPFAEAALTTLLAK